MMARRCSGKGKHVKTVQQPAAPCGVRQEEEACIRVSLVVARKTLVGF